MRALLTSLRGGRLVVALVIGIGVLLGAGRLASTIYTELLWHSSSGYIGVLWTRLLWEWGTRIVAGLAVGIAVFFNLRIVARTLSGIQIKRRFGNLEISEQLPGAYVFWTMAGSSALVALWFGAAVPSALGLQVLMLSHAPSWGVADPILGRDLSFHVFWVPVLASAVTFALVVAFLLFTLSSAGYAATGSLRWGRGRVVAQDLPRAHLGALIALFLLLLAGRLWLGQYMLLRDGSSQVLDIFGYADAEARLPALQTLAVVAVLGAVATLWSAAGNRGKAMATSLVSVAVAFVLIGQIYPAMIQRVQVEPNELERETPFIEYNLAFTRMGFGLDSLERRRFEMQPDEPVDWREAAAQFSGLPVWTRSALLASFRANHSGLQYYNFGDVTIDRYDSESGPVVVALSVREVVPANIPDQNWQNLHLRELYLSGMGAVASLATSRTADDSPPMVLAGTPPELRGGAAPQGLALTRPRVFISGLSAPFDFAGRGRELSHVVINPSNEQFLAPDSTPGVAGVDFPPGIPLSSGLRTLAWAWRLRDANLLFASEVDRESRFLFRRTADDMASAIAPFLRFPEDPYPVVADGRIVWILEGFTGTRAFPLSTLEELQLLREVNYVRNSVKVTVDAVTGQIDFYRVPVADPLADAYEGAFPGLFKPLDQMPANLRAHIRYSRELMRLQSKVLGQYHQETAAAIHGQQDVWETPAELGEGTTPVNLEPEYGVWTLPGEHEPHFQLSTAFVPSARQTLLTALLVARIGDDGAPELILFDLPAEHQVPGPRQVESLIEQDTFISQQFSLWRTGGSDVWTGRLHIVPVGGRILYMEGIFLAAEGAAIPQLRRYVVSDGRRAVMGENLEAAIAQLAGVAAPAPGGAGAAPGGSGAGAAWWPGDALELLDQAEEHLRSGDWEGFGRALQELRRRLEDLGGGPVAS